MKKGILLLALLMLVGAPISTAQPPANLVINGDFEGSAPHSCASPTGYVVAPPTEIPPWAVSEETVDVVCFSLLQAQSGLQSIDLTGTPGTGTLIQNPLTEAGEQYLLSFWMAGNPGCDDPVKRMEVRWDGSVLDTLSFDTTGKSGTNMGWVQHQYTVTATVTPTTLLGFESLTGTFCGPMLDNVSLQAFDDDDGDGEDDDEDGEDEDGDGDDDDGDDDDDDDD